MNGDTILLLKMVIFPCHISQFTGGYIFSCQLYSTITTQHRRFECLQHMFVERSGALRAFFCVPAPIHGGSSQ